MFLFGSGQLFGKRTDVANPTPVQFGTMQDVQIDFDRTLKELFGQYQYPEAIGAAMIKVSGKAKFAKINGQVMTNLFFSDTLNTGMRQFTPLGEAHTVPAPSGPYTVTVTNAADFLGDFGVYYAATGIQLTRVAAAAEAVGKYSVNESTGVYTFAAADASAALVFYYEYSVTSGKSITMTNQLQGTAPQFQCILRNSYPAGSSSEQSVTLQLNACIAGKLSMPFKQGDFVVSEMDFQAFTDASNVLGHFGFTS